MPPSVPASVQVAAVGRTRIDVSIIAVDGHVISEPYKGSIR